MRMYDIIYKKKMGEILTKQEIEFVVSGYTNGTIPDYQMSALLMAINLKGMNNEETTELTLAMANSGDIVNLEKINGIKVDKHSTGGVGDKTTLIISPIVASLGVPIAKMSGRGLGHTGGTVDKLESIPNLQTGFSKDEFIDIVNEVGICVAGQSGNLAPADKKIYALRDVTATVDNISLIAASIMSKKIAAGSDCILLDVKTGSGAFMKTLEDSIKLGEAMVSIGELAGRKTRALVTNMNIPLGNAIGNNLEIIEVVETLKGNGPKDLTDVCVALAKEMLILSGKYQEDECEKLIWESINSGKALEKLIEMVEAQNGDTSVIKNTENFEKSKYIFEVKSQKDGYINNMDTTGIGIASMILGAGREKEDSVIDYSAGIILNKKVGDFVKNGDILCYLHTNADSAIENSQTKFLSSVSISKQEPIKEKLIFAKIEKDFVIKF